MANQEMLSPFYILFLSFSSYLCFNIDPRFAVLKVGSVNSYFGYSVSLHQIVSEHNKDNVEENVLLVGAPKENVTGSDGTEIGGAVYKCNATSTSPDDCIRLTGLLLDTAPVEKAHMEDEWLGVVVNSYGKGQKVVICGHRFIQMNSALGRCVILPQTLKDEDRRLHIPCLNKPHLYYMEDFGMCQAGMSATIGPSESLAVGAPGSLFWRGVVFQMNISTAFGVASGPFNSPIPVDPSEDGADQAQPPPTHKYSYLGYSVALGRFDSSGSLYIVSGAPRTDEKGVVIFFRKVPRVSVIQYEPHHRLDGPLEFSAFGSVLLVVDLNNDGFDDLIVGAPYFFEKGIGGAIYIYYGGSKMIDKTTDKVEILSRKMESQECTALECESARFGASLATLGDINRDGYKDFAVGAPYEGNGAVYIYHGSADGVIPIYAQRIIAAEIPVTGDLKSFGHSLSGGLDMDNNGYPDLLVGSFESGHVALLRSRPIIRIHPRITVTPNLIDLDDVQFCTVDKSSRRCVEIEICLAFTAEPVEKFNGKPIIQYRMTAEHSRTIARLEFSSSTIASKKYVDEEVQMYRQSTGQEKCDTQLAHIKETFVDKLNPIEVSITLSQRDDHYVRPTLGQPLADINNYPVLFLDGQSPGADADTLLAYVDFVKECGDDNQCFSNLQFEVSLDARKEDNLYILLEGEFSEVQLTFIITNLGEAAYLAQVFVQKPINLDYQSVNGNGQDKAVKCLPEENNDTMITCDDIGNPLKLDNSVTFTVTLKSRITELNREFNITTWVKTSSNEQTPLTDKKVFFFMVIREADLVVTANVRPDDQILCSGEAVGASAMRNEEDIGTAVNHSYIVSNRGPSNVSSSMLNIDWPLEVANGGAEGKYLLYLMEPPIVEYGSAVCFYDDEGLVNPLGIPPVIGNGLMVEISTLPARNTGASRRKRNTDDMRFTRDAKNGMTILGCKQKTARCRLISCQLGHLIGGQGYVKITLRSRLWESTLLQDYRTSGDVLISSYASVSIDPYLQIEQNTENDFAEAVTYAVPDITEAVKMVEWWWILLAILGGLVLLIIIVFILYKVGFFKRKRPEDMKMYRAEKKHQKMLVDNDDAMT